MVIVMAIEEANDCIQEFNVNRNLLSKETLEAVSKMLARPMPCVGDILDRRQMLLDERRRKGAKQGKTHDNNTEERGQVNDLIIEDPKIAKLKTGEVMSCDVAFGRRENIVTSVKVTTDTDLVEARELILTADPSLQSYKFVSLQGAVITRAQEDKRFVLMDCGNPLQLRPDAWINFDDE